MKRARTEQLQTALFLYLKRRNFTDSEASFRNNTQFEETLMDTASRTLLQNKFASLDSVAMTTQSLTEYFVAFQVFREFVMKSACNPDYHRLKTLLFPIFVHSYLDLIVAGRLTEADEFFYDYGNNDHFQEFNQILSSLRTIRETSDIKKCIVITKVRNNLCRIVLSDKEKQLLLRFLQGQPDLLVMKLINERIRISDIDKITSETSHHLQDEKEKDSSSLGTSIEQALPPSAGINTSTLDAEKPPVVPMIISPPSLTQSCTMSMNTTHAQSPENVVCNTLIDESTLRKHILKVRDTAPTVENICLFKLKDTCDAIIHTTMSNNKKFVCSGHEESTVNIWNVCYPKHAMASDSKSRVLFPAGFQQESFEKSEIFERKLETPTADISQVCFGSDFREDVSSRFKKNLAQKQHELFVEPRVTCLRGHSGPVYSSCFTHDDKFLLSCSEDTTVRLWDMESLCNRVVYKGHDMPVWCIDISAFSMYFATGSYDNTAKLWSLDRTFPLRIYAGHHHSVGSVRFHGNASYIATADRTVRLWDLNSGKTVRLMVGHWAPVTCLAFSPDGKFLASSGEDCRIRIWDILSSNLIKEIRGHTDTVHSLHYSQDGALLASCAADCSVYVWNVNTTVSGNSSETTASSTTNPNVTGHWQFGARASRLLSSSFAEDILNVFAVE